MFYIVPQEEKSPLTSWNIVTKSQTAFNFGKRSVAFLEILKYKMKQMKPPFTRVINSHTPQYETNVSSKFKKKLENAQKVCVQFNPKDFFRCVKQFRT